jgi:hypothetical protein
MGEREAMCPDFIFFGKIGGEGGAANFCGMIRWLLHTLNSASSQPMITKSVTLQPREINCILYIIGIIYEKPDQWDCFRDQSFVNPIQRTPGINAPHPFPQLSLVDPSSLFYRLCSF